MGLWSCWARAILTVIACVHVLLLPTDAVFTNTPKSVTQAEGHDAVFLCQHSVSNTVIAWIMNGMDVQVSTSPTDNTTTLGTITNKNNETVHTLTLKANALNNGTEIQCRAYVNVTIFGTVVLPSIMVEVTPKVTLIVQGPLGRVDNLTSTSTNDSITITWNPPFSLDLTTADPDIAYCVDVFNITSDGQREMIASNCSVLQPQYIFTVDSPDPSDLFEFTVTPRSNVEDAMNGTTSEPVEGYFKKQSPMNPTSTIEIWTSLNSSEVCTSCKFSDNSTTSCVSVIYSVNGHMTSPYGVLNITVNEQRACDCISLPPGDYRVDVFACQNGTMTTATPIQIVFVTVSNKPATKPTKPKPKYKAIIGLSTSCGTLFCVVVLAVTVSVVCWWFCKNRKEDNRHHDGSQKEETEKKDKKATQTESVLIEMGERTSLQHDPLNQKDSTTTTQETSQKLPTTQFCRDSMQQVSSSVPVENNSSVRPYGTPLGEATGNSTVNAYAQVPPPKETQCADFQECSARAKVFIGGDDIYFRHNINAHVTDGATQLEESSPSAHEAGSI